MSTNEGNSDMKLVPITNFDEDSGMYYKDKIDSMDQVDMLLKSAKIYSESFLLFELSNRIPGSRSELFVDVRNFWFLSFLKEKPHVSKYYTMSLDKNTFFIKFDNLFITDGMYTKPEGVSFYLLQSSQSVLNKIDPHNNKFGDVISAKVIMNDTNNNSKTVEIELRVITIEMIIKLLNDIKLSIHSEGNPGGMLTDESFLSIQMCFNFSNETTLLTEFKNINDKKELKNFFDSEEKKQWFQVMIQNNHNIFQSKTLKPNTQSNPSNEISTNEFKQEKVSFEGDFPTNLHFRIKFQGLNSSKKSELKNILEKAEETQSEVDKKVKPKSDSWKKKRLSSAQFKVSMTYILLIVEGFMANKSSNDLMKARSEIIILTSIMADVDKEHDPSPILHLFKEYSPIVASYYFSSVIKVHLMFAFNDMQLLNNIIECENLTSLSDISKSKHKYNYLISIPHGKPDKYQTSLSITSSSSDKIQNLNEMEGFQLRLATEEQTLLQKYIYFSSM